MTKASYAGSGRSTRARREHGSVSAPGLRAAMEAVGADYSGDTTKFSTRIRNYGDLSADRVPDGRGSDWG